jgi:hypothetical protein
VKKAFVTALAVLVSQTAFAGDLYCGSNIEKVPGSQVYNKLLFWEKVDQTNIHYLLADGTLLSQKNVTPEAFAKIVDGTLVMGITFNQGKPQIFIAKVKRNNNTINFTDMAHATSLDGSSPFLMANGVVLMCKEL